MITIQLHWWYVLIILFGGPIIYAWFRNPSGDYDFMMDVALVIAIGWAGGLLYLLGHYLR